MSEEINYEQRVENYKKFFREFSGLDVGINVDNQLYYAYTSEQFEQKVLDIKYHPYNEIQTRLKYINSIKRSLETMSKENSESTFQEYRNIVDKNVEIVDALLRLLHMMYIVKEYKKTGTEFEIKWVHGYEPLNQE